MFLRKLGATIYLLWFALYLGAPQYVHHCPEHSAAAPAASSHDAGHGDHGATKPAQDEAHKCCCPGPQCGSATMVPADVAPLGTELPVLREQRRPLRTSLASTARSEHVLPFATAPPSPIA